MNVIYLLILASLGVALLFLGAFIWAVRSGQYEDTCTPAMRLLADEDSRPSREPGSKHGEPPSPSS